MKFVFYFLYLTPFSTLHFKKMARLSFLAILGDLSALCMRLDISHIWQPWT